jgi:hypothetical protein
MSCVRLVVIVCTTIHKTDQNIGRCYRRDPVRWCRLDGTPVTELTACVRPGAAPAGRLEFVLARGDYGVSMRRNGGVTHVLLFSLMSASCGSSQSSQPSPVTTSIAVTLPSVLPAGESVQATAMATLSNGEGKLLATGWQSDSMAVAAVTASGLVTGVANGFATISVTSDGVKGSKTVRVVPSYQGAWNGSYRVDRCSPFPTPAYAQFCIGYTAGTVIPLSMTFSQNGEVVDGQFVAGGLTSSSFVAAITRDGEVELKGTNTTFPYAYEFSWLLGATAPGRITGIVALRRSGSAGLIGGADVEGTIVSLTR